MGLDFSRLDQLSFSEGINEPQEEQPARKPSKMPSEPFFEEEEYKTTIEPKNASQGLTENLQGIPPILQRQADANGAEKERTLAIYREYQENTRRSGQLQTEILKGVKLGEDIYSLFLKAVQAVSLMTSNTVFYNQISEDIKAIYGAGLSEPKPLALELEEVLGRLERLREARRRGTEGADGLQRIERAIQAHEQRAALLQGWIEKAQGGESLQA